MPTEDTLRRLAFIRYLYNIAIDQSRQPEPLGAASILTFHDSVELFLQLASEHLNVVAKKSEFMDYWPLIKPKLSGNGLTYEASMKRLNKSRVGLKHYGILPSNLDIEGFRASATNFFEENTPLVFGIEFGSISMVHLVECVEVRSSLEEASRRMVEGRNEEALDKIAIGFVQLVAYHEERTRTWFSRSPFIFGERFSWTDSVLIRVTDHNFRQFADKVSRSIQAIQDGMEIISLGLNYTRYVKFKLLTPHVNRLGGGAKYEIAKLREGAPFLIDDCRFCHDFVVDSALRLQNFHALLQK